MAAGAGVAMGAGGLTALGAGAEGLLAGGSGWSTGGAVGNVAEGLRGSGSETGAGGAVGSVAEGRRGSGSETGAGGTTGTVAEGRRSGGSVRAGSEARLGPSVFIWTMGVGGGGSSDPSGERTVGVGVGGVPLAPMGAETIVVGGSGGSSRFSGGCGRTIGVGAGGSSSEAALGIFCSRNGNPITTGGSLGRASGSVLMRRGSTPSFSTWPTTSGSSSRDVFRAGAGAEGLAGSVPGAGAGLPRGERLPSGGTKVASRLVGVPVIVGAGSSSRAPTGTERPSSSSS